MAFRKSIGLCVLASIVPLAAATNITFQFEAQVTSISGVGFEHWHNAIMGDPTLTGTYTFADDLPDTYPPTYQGRYSASGDLVLDVGWYHIVEPGFDIGVSNFAYDWYHVVRSMSFQPPFDESVDIGFYELLMENHGAPQFATDALPLVPPDLTAFTDNPQDSAIFRWTGQHFWDAGIRSYFELEAEITSLTLVPEPAAAWLLVAGCGVFSRRR
jgi:hypothetical protein